MAEPVSASDVFAAPAPGGGAACDPEAAYYQAVEEYFVSRRGDPLFLSNPDWLLVRRWRTEGVPLRIVLRGIGDALSGHARSWGRKRKVGSLAYCAAAVDDAAARWRRALAVGDEDGARLVSALGALADTLASAPLPASARGEAAALAERLREWSSAAPDLREVEPHLAAGERALVALLKRAEDPAVMLALETQADAELAAYASRMPAKVLDQVRVESVTRRLLARHGLPRLSLVGL